MTCANCEALRDEVDRLKRELGVRREAGEIGAVMSALDVSALKARLLLRLYAAKGRVVTSEALCDELSGATRETLRSHIYQLRQRFGEDAVVTSGNLGYALPVEMLSAILAALQPPVLQEVRG